MNILITENEAQLFPKHTVRELLFDGYADDLIDAGQDLGFNVPYDKFGWYYGRNNSATDGTYSIFTGEAETMDKFGLLHSWNNQQMLPFWNGYQCNRLDQSTPGDFRPPYVQPKPSVIYIFVGDICRSLPLHYLKTIEYHGLVVDRYWAGHQVFDYTLSENKCYCSPDGYEGN